MGRQDPVAPRGRKDRFSAVTWHDQIWALDGTLDGSRLREANGKQRESFGGAVATWRSSGGCLERQRVGGKRVPVLGCEQAEMALVTSQ